MKEPEEEKETKETVILAEDEMSDHDFDLKSQEKLSDFKENSDITIHGRGRLVIDSKMIVERAFLDELQRKLRITALNIAHENAKCARHEAHPTDFGTYEIDLIHQKLNINDFHHLKCIQYKTNAEVNYF